MKRVLIAAAAMTVAGVYSVQAADLAARPYYTKAVPAMVASVYDWSGLYIGLNGGGGSSHDCWWVSDPVFEGCHNAKGGTFGGQIGYRWQAAHWVFGIEGQGNWADFSGSNGSLAGPEVAVMYGQNIGAYYDNNVNRSRIDSFGLITGQVGYAWNNVLLYVKGGAAVVGGKFDVLRKDNGDLRGSVSNSQWGSTVGAGLEVGFAPNWSVGVEYDHIFLGDRNGVCIENAHPCPTNYRTLSQDVDMGLVRLNYKFGGPVVARY